MKYCDKCKERITKSYFVTNYTLDIACSEEHMKELLTYIGYPNTDDMYMEEELEPDFTFDKVYKGPDVVGYSGSINIDSDFTVQELLDTIPGVGLDWKISLYIDEGQPEYAQINILKP